MIRYNNTQKQKKMLQSLINIATKHKCSISHHEFCGDFVIGLDKNNKHVFFYRERKEINLSKSIDLSKIKSCQAIKTRTITKANNGDFIVKIELNFKPIDKSFKEIKLELYNEENTELSGEIQLVDEWEKQINKLI
ncbi:hypothetical protein AXE80_06415 [Wenyingzhuangia fucanilytica]|uniref:Uncharacterized protein n=2 Tax=Wenyingzhuangia fucanilytica TaxID=1790137 RepID=A0A1B1Y596_9FLAO|nr:hypothetical protein AXE80_06415 [Wenyingzhuangia fucanilytica]